jgi:hypothetical protein
MDPKRTTANCGIVDCGTGRQFYKVAARDSTCEKTVLQVHYSTSKEGVYRAATESWRAALCYVRLSDRCEQSLVV